MESVMAFDERAPKPEPKAPPQEPKDKPQAKSEGRYTFDDWAAI